MSWIKVSLGNYKQNKHRKDDLWALKASALVISGKNEVMVRMWWREYQNTVDVLMMLSVASEHSYC